MTPVGDIPVTQHTESENKKSDRGFVIPAPKLACPEIFSSIGRVFERGDDNGPSPGFGVFPNFLRDLLKSG